MSAGFVVIGKELRDLMREEGMVAVTKVDAEGEADLYRFFKRYKERVGEILSLVENAIDTADVGTVLQQNGAADGFRSEHKKNLSKGRPISVIYHREDPPAGFMFGVTVSPPNRHARQRGKTFDSTGYEAELLVGYKMLDGSGDSLQMHDGLEGIAETLNSTLRGFPDSDVEVFVPENTSYQKFVARAPVPGTDSAEDQAQLMGQFYRAFVSVFVEAEGPDGRRMLDHLRDLHLQAVERE